MRSCLFKLTPPHILFPSFSTHLIPFASVFSPSHIQASSAPMALRFGLSFFLILPILLLSYSAAAADVNDDDQLLASINRYRASLKVPALIENENADCFADEIADQYKNRVCSTVLGIEELSDYPQLLAYCNINISSIKGVIMPVCMPNIETTPVISTFTQSLYSGYLNDSQYTGSGIASEDNWIVVVLTARASNRNFTRANVTDDDEEDLLRNGINRYRASLNLSALIENENAECFADKIADLFDYRACRNTTGAITLPSTQYQLPNFPLFLAQCNLNLSNTRGVIMPACVPNLEASLVLSNFTQSQYSWYVNDSQYIGAGIATEDDWIIVVLTTKMTRGIFTRANASGMVLKTSLDCKVTSSLFSFLMILMISPHSRPDVSG